MGVFLSKVVSWSLATEVSSEDGVSGSIRLLSVGGVFLATCLVITCLLNTGNCDLSGMATVLCLGSAFVFGGVVVGDNCTSGVGGGVKITGRGKARSGRAWRCANTLVTYQGFRR